MGRAYRPRHHLSHGEEAGDICADVYFAEPVEVTRWAHLMGVRGIATLDPAQENKIIIRGAIETDD